MSVDPDTARFLALFEEPDAAIEAQPLEAAREGYRQLFAEAAPAAPPVHRRDLHCSGPQGEVPCRLYQPTSVAREPRALLVFLHGGGGVLGDIASYDSLAAWLCHHGDHVVLLPEYRLAPEHPFPAGIIDCHAVVNWASLQAQEWGASPDRLMLIGDSTGGSLCNACVLLAGNLSAARVAGQALLYPQLDMRLQHDYPSRHAFADGRYFLGESGIAWSRAHYLTDESESHSPLATALCAETLEWLPPTLILTAGLDPLRDEGVAYALALRDAGVPGIYHCIDKGIHGCLSFAGQLDHGTHALHWLLVRLSDLLDGHSDWSDLPASLHSGPEQG